MVCLRRRTILAAIAKRLCLDLWLGRRDSRFAKFVRNAAYIPSRPRWLC